MKDKGVALILTLFIATVVLIAAAVLFGFVRSQTRISGVEKEYLLSCEITKGAVEDFAHDIRAGIYSGNSSGEWISDEKKKEILSFAPEDTWSIKVSSSSEVIDNYHWKKKHDNYTTYALVSEKIISISEDWGKKMILRVEFVTVRRNLKTKSWFSAVYEITLD